MSENTIKLLPEELQSLQLIQTKYQEKIFQFGQFYLEKLALDDKIKKLVDTETLIRNEFVTLQNEEKQWMDTIASKYGDGNLSLKDGTFTPVQK
jgi:low affinity Fe/Cu permease